MDHGPIGEAMDVDDPEPAPDAVEEGDSDSGSDTLDMMRERAARRREESPEARWKRKDEERESYAKDQQSRSDRLQKQRAADAKDLERKATELPGLKRERDEAKMKLKDIQKQKGQLENELRKAREGGVSAEFKEGLDLAPPKGRLPITEELMAPALLAWDCAQTFNDKLNLCRYSFDDYAAAVSDGAPDSVLLVETVRSMLRMVLKEGLVGLEEEGEASEEEKEEEEEEEEEEEVNYEEEESEAEEEQEQPTGRKRKAVQRLGVVHGAAPAKRRPPRSARRRRSIKSANSVTPQNWESMLRRSLRSCAHVAAGKKEQWFASCAGAHQARRALKGKSFSALPASQKVGALAVLALAVYRSQVCRRALSDRKNKEDAWGKDSRKADRQKRKDADTAKAQLKKEALEQIKEDLKAKAKALGDKAPKKIADIKEKEVTAKMNAMAKEQALGGKKVLTKPPADEPISDDEEELDADEEGIKTTEKKKRQGTNQGARRRNKVRVHRREDRGKRDVYRTSAAKDLREALASGDVKLLKNALKTAEKAELLGEDGGPNDEAWCTSQVADALKKLAAANPAHVACSYKMREERDCLMKDSDGNGNAGTGVRREPLGVDRSGCRYFDLDESSRFRGGLCRVFAQKLVPAPAPPRAPPTPGGEEPVSGEDLPHQLREVSEWSCYSSRKEVKALYRALDDAFDDERDLKNALADRYAADEPYEGDNGWRDEGNEAIGALVAREYAREFKSAVVVGWVPKGQVEDDGTTVEMDLWHIEVDDGETEDLEEHELVEARDRAGRCFRKYTNLCEGDKGMDFREARQYVYNQSAQTPRRDLINELGYEEKQLDGLLD